MKITPTTAVLFLLLSLLLGFLVGRSSDDNIDLVIMDTVAGARSAEECMVKESTISRFACRILIDREPPYTARIYAAGFDKARNIFLGEKALRWTTKGDVDGLTTNGILVLRPRENFDRDAEPGLWREVSVNGGVYPMRDSRATPTKAEMVIALHSAVALAQMDGVAVAIGENLNLDVSAALDQLFQVHARIAKCGPRLLWQCWKRRICDTKSTTLNFLFLRQRNNPVFCIFKSFFKSHFKIKQVLLN